MIQRTPRRNNFTIIGNGIFTENALSFEAMGLLAYLLSKPDNWQVHVQALVRATEGTAQKRGENKILALLRELIGAGYIIRQRQSSGKMDYYVYDEPQGEPSADTTPYSSSCAENASQPIENKPQPSKPHVAKPHVAKPREAFEGVLISTEGQQELNLSKDGRETSARATPPASPPPDPPPKPKRRSKADEFVAFVVARGVEEATARAWWPYHGGKEMSEYAWNRHCRQAEAAGISPQEAAAYAAERKWQGFYANSYLRDMAETEQAKQMRDRMAAQPQGRVFDQTGREVMQPGMPMAGGFGGQPQRTSKMAQGISLLEELKDEIRRGEV